MKKIVLAYLAMLKILGDAIVDLGHWLVVLGNRLWFRAHTRIEDMTGTAKAPEIYTYTMNYGYNKQPDPEGHLKPIDNPAKVAFPPLDASPTYSDEEVDMAISMSEVKNQGGWEGEVAKSLVEPGTPRDTKGEPVIKTGIANWADYKVKGAAARAWNRSEAITNDCVVKVLDSVEAMLKAELAKAPVEPGTPLDTKGEPVIKTAIATLKDIEAEAIRAYDEMVYRRPPAFKKPSKRKPKKVAKKVASKKPKK